MKTSLKRINELARQRNVGHYTETPTIHLTLRNSARLLHDSSRCPWWLSQNGMGYCRTSRSTRNQEIVCLLGLKFNPWTLLDTGLQDGERTTLRGTRKWTQARGTLRNFVLDTSWADEFEG